MSDAMAVGPLDYREVVTELNQLAWEEQMKKGGTAEIVNPSGLAPLGRAVLVEPFEPERKASAIVLPPTVLGNERAVDVRVRVVEVGPACWPDEPSRAQAGDVVFIAKMSGFVAQGPKDGKPYRLVNDRDIFAKVTWLGE